MISCQEWQSISTIFQSCFFSSSLFSTWITNSIVFSVWVRFFVVDATFFLCLNFKYDDFSVTVNRNTKYDLNCHLVRNIGQYYDCFDFHFSISKQSSFISQSQRRRERGGGEKDIRKERERVVSLVHRNMNIICIGRKWVVTWIGSIVEREVEKKKLLTQAANLCCQSDRSDQSHTQSIQLEPSN